MSKNPLTGSKMDQVIDASESLKKGVQMAFMLVMLEFRNNEVVSNAYLAKYAPDLYPIQQLDPDARKVFVAIGEGAELIFDSMLTTIKNRVAATDMAAEVWDRIFSAQVVSLKFFMDSFKK
jgi:hypothetical protein